MKKILSAVMVMVFALALSVNAMAATTVDSLFATYGPHYPQLAGYKDQIKERVEKTLPEAGYTVDMDKVAADIDVIHNAVINLKNQSPKDATVDGEAVIATVFASDKAVRDAVYDLEDQLKINFKFDGQNATITDTLTSKPMAEPTAVIKYTGSTAFAGTFAVVALFAVALLGCAAVSHKRKLVVA